MKQCLLASLLCLAAPSIVRAQEPSDQPSDVPSFVPTYSPSEIPSSLPTIIVPPGSGQYPSCPVCPIGQSITLPDEVLQQGQTCATSNLAGLAGNIPPVQCGQLQLFGPALCDCQPIAVDETMSPTRAPAVVGTGSVPAPSPRDLEVCDSTTCTLVPTWSQVAAFVAAAADGDLLCMCGRFYDGSLCPESNGATVILDDEESKAVSLQCATGQICSYNCLPTAVVVSTGSLSLVGSNDTNFILTGGSSFSRVLVGEDGSLIATHVAFQDTKASALVTGERRRLQNANGKGGGVETYGTTLIEDSVFDNCTSAVEGGAIFVGGGSTTVRRSTLKRNSAFNGGAIFVADGSLTLEDSTLEQNTAINTLGSGNVFARGDATVEACGNTVADDALLAGDACSSAALTGYGLGVALVAVTSVWMLWV